MYFYITTNAAGFTVTACYYYSMLQHANILLLLVLQHEPLDYGNSAVFEHKRERGFFFQIRLKYKVVCFMTFQNSPF